MFSIGIALIFAPILLYASSLVLRFAAEIIGQTHVGLVGFVFAAPIALLLIVTFFRLLGEIRRQCLIVFPLLQIATKPEPPAVWLGATISLCIILASMWLWWHQAFPPGSLLTRGVVTEMRVAKLTTRPIGENSLKFYSQQIWIEHVQSRQRSERRAQYPLLAPSSIGEDENPMTLINVAQNYPAGSAVRVWTEDLQNGPFFERRYNARAFAALIWWLCAGLVLFSFVVYLNLRFRFAQQGYAHLVPGQRARRFQK